MDKQLVAERLKSLYGVHVRVGLHSFLEDVRNAKGKVISQIRHDEGEKFTCDDGAPVPQADIDEAVQWVLDNPPPPPPPQRDLLAELDAMRARVDELERTRNP